MDLVDPQIWKGQWEAFVSAPYVILPLLTCVAASTFWLTKQFTQSQINASELALKAANDHAKAQVEAAQANAKERMDILLERMKLADDKEAALKSQIEELKIALSSGNVSANIATQGDRLDKAYDEFQEASSNATSAVEKAAGAIQHIFGAAVRAVGS